jgi:RHS repeat-associated protein
MSTNSIPYGSLISSSGTLAGANTMRFSSKPAIFSTTGAWGFYYYGYRFYDPGMQRWLNRDPLGESGGWNLGAFLENGSANSVDALGLVKTVLPSKPLDPNLTTIVCKGGKAVPRVGLGHKASEGGISLCVMKCTLTHEQVHAADANAHKVCEGKPDGSVILWEDDELYDTELRAHKAQLACLMKAKEQYNGGNGEAEDCVCRRTNLEAAISKAARIVAAFEKANRSDRQTWPIEYRQ